jgi:predicted ATP-binding protein involved in virulence
MRLTRVHVTGLFGLFDHEIRLNADERVTIIHGPNGFGKTLVLRMIEALISGQYELFYKVPFKVFTLEADTGVSLSVERVETRSPEQTRYTVYVGTHLPNIAPGRYWKCRTETSQSSWLIRSETLDPERGRVEENEDEPEWLATARSGFPKARLTLTQRLAQVENLGKPTVKAYSDELASHIQQKLAEYAARSQELDRSFPVRLLGRPKVHVLTAEALRERLAALERRRTELTRLGFLDPEPGTDLGETSVEAIETKRDVLSVYVEDMETKLAIFDELASKIQVFTRIINERFLLKSLAIHREQGFVFTSATETRLKPSDLSSGEQHELVLFYELLFQMKKNELLLIDEPEISLHVAWQEKFLGDLSEVVKLSGVDVVIATHSPEIIGDHWNLTVELKGPPEVHKG